MTTTVVPTTSPRLGQLTFLTSTQTSRRKSRVVGHHSLIGVICSARSTRADGSKRPLSTIPWPKGLCSARSTLRFPRFELSLLFSSADERLLHWQGWRDSNPQHPVLETGALPIRATPLDFSFLVSRVLTAEPAILRKLQLLGVRLLVLRRGVVLPLALGASKTDRLLHGVLLQDLRNGSGTSQRSLDASEHE